MMEPRGFVFLASHTIPGRNCSFVLKYQAVESGMTGIRVIGSDGHVADSRN